MTWRTLLPLLITAMVVCVTLGVKLIAYSDKSSLFETPNDVTLSAATVLLALLAADKLILKAQPARIPKRVPNPLGLGLRAKLLVKAGSCIVVWILGLLLVGRVKKDFLDANVYDVWQCYCVAAAVWTFAGASTYVAMDCARSTVEG